MANEDAKYTIDDHVRQALARLPSMHDESYYLRGILEIEAERTQTLENVLRDITADVLFRIDTAIGAQQDQIGTIIGIAREGRTDDEYRIILRTQALLVLPERRTQARLMEIVRSLMDDDPGAIGYRQFPPKNYELTVESVPLEKLMSWIPILRRTRPATYNGILGWTDPNHITYGDASGNPMITDTWNGYGDASGTVVETWHGYSAQIIF